MIPIGEGSNQTPEVKYEKGTKPRPGTLYIYIYIYLALCCSVLYRLKERSTDARRTILPIP